MREKFWAPFSYPFPAEGRKRRKRKPEKNENVTPWLKKIEAHLTRWPLNQPQPRLISAVEAVEAAEASRFPSNQVHFLSQFETPLRSNAESQDSLSFKSYSRTFENFALPLKYFKFLRNRT